MVRDTTLYDRLEVPPNASESDIKKEYNRLSKKWHPDKNPNNVEEATKKFQEISQAKDVLLDKERRALYDQHGMGMFDSPQASGPTVNPFQDFADIFGASFPFGMGSMPGWQSRNPPQEDIIETINVTLEQLYNGDTINFNYTQRMSCTKCDGEGVKEGKQSTCQDCQGKGMRTQVTRMGPIIQQITSPCNTCRGKGKSVKDEDKCEQCNGRGFNNKDKSIQIPLKPGLSNGNKICLSGKGHQLKNIKSDLILVINELPHKTFRRYQNDLFIEVNLKLYQALFGFDKVIEHLDKRKLHISCSGKTDFNTIRKISGEGLRLINSENKGDLYIRFNINLPNLSSLPQEMKSQLKVLLQSFDMTEVNNETRVLKTPNLMKTILNDCKPEQTVMLNKIIDNIKENTPDS